MYTGSSIQIIFFPESRPPVDRPEISVIITPNRVNVDEGSEVVLECQVVNGNSRIIWERNGARINTEGSINDPRLVLRNLRREDAGTYTCTTVDLPERKEAYVEVVINGTTAAINFGHFALILPPVRPGLKQEVGKYFYAH